MIQLLKKFYNNKKDLFLITSLSLIFLTVFFSTTIILKNNRVYDLSPILEDRFYSLDDLHYATRIYNPDKDNMTGPMNLFSSVKHPLLSFNAHIFSSAEKMINKDIPFIRHHLNIIFIQLITSLIGIIFLYKTLSEIIKLSKFQSFLLTLIYLFSNTILITTVITDSFIFGATSLIVAYYLLSKQKYILSGILGSLIFGITITNVVIWGIMVLALGGFRLKPLLKIFYSFSITTLLVVLIMYLYNSAYLYMIMSNFFKVIKINAELFKMDYNLLITIRNGFYYLFGAAFFYINTTNTTPLGLNKNMTISFLPSANVWISFLGISMLLLIVIFLIKNIKNKDKNIIACFFIIIFNIILHCAFKFGLNEAFIYTSHILFVYIILLAIILKYYSSYKKELLMFITIILITQAFNFRSIIDIIRVVR